MTRPDKPTYKMTRREILSWIMSNAWSHYRKNEYYQQLFGKSGFQVCLREAWVQYHHAVERDNQSRPLELPVTKETEKAVRVAVAVTVPGGTKSVIDEFWLPKKGATIAVTNSEATISNWGKKMLTTKFCQAYPEAYAFCNKLIIK